MMERLFRGAKKDPKRRATDFDGVETFSFASKKDDSV